METISSEEYFEKLKSHKEEMTKQGLEEFYLNCLYMLHKYEITNQIDAMKKVIFLLEVAGKEKQLLDLKINHYIYKEHIDEYIKAIADDDVSIIELSRYERIIPDEVTEKIENCKEIFDNFYVLFTDYSSTHQRKIERERKNQDPILFGTFENDENIAERFYFIADWIDEYCDLTLDKFLNDFKQKKSVGRSEILKDIYTSEKLSDMKEKLSNLHFDVERGKFVERNSKPKQKSVWQRIKEWFKCR